VFTDVLSDRRSGASGVSEAEPGSARSGPTHTFALEALVATPTRPSFPPNRGRPAVRPLFTMGDSNYPFRKVFVTSAPTVTTIAIIGILTVTIRLKQTCFALEP
jgi:hypothetical protein